MVGPKASEKVESQASRPSATVALLLPRSPAGRASRARRTRTKCRRWRVRSIWHGAGCRSGPRAHGEARQGRGKRAFGLFFNVHGPTTRGTSPDGVGETRGSLFLTRRPLTGTADARDSVDSHSDDSVPGRAAAS